MKKYTLAFLTTLLVLTGTLFSQNAQASHAAGGELTYRWVSDSLYRITFKFYRDCSSGTTAPTAATLCIYNDCNTTNTSLNMPLLSGPNRASSSCTQNQCDNINSIIPGYEEYIYSVDLRLASRCNSWHFSTWIGSRNPTNNLATTANQTVSNSSSANFYIETTLNNVAAQGNSSPEFSVKPVPFVCMYRPYNYNNGVTDIDNDSLSYEMVMPQQGDCAAHGSDMFFVVNSLIAQSYGLQTNPLPTNNSFILNQQTGQLTFTPDGIGIATGGYGIALRVNEWRNGIKIGSIIRDIQVIYRANCPNTPDPIFSTDPGNSNGINFTSTRAEGCVNKPLLLCVHGVSTDSTEKLKIESNYIVSAPGSTIAYSGMGTDTVGACLTWTPTINDTGMHVITYTVTDTNCNTNGGIPRPQTFSIALYINPVTTASPNRTICAGDTAHLRVVGGGDWLWTALQGGATDTSLSCTVCQEPIASPVVTTTYVVTARTSNSFCNINSDTVTITVAPPAAFYAGPDTTTCVNNSLQLNAVVSPGAGTNYTITWTPATYLSNPNIPNPIIVNPAADISYVIKVVPGGIATCAFYDTLRVNVLQGFNFTNIDTQICKGTSIPIRFAGDSRYAYTWTPSVGVTDIHVGDATITPDTSHTYILTGTFPGCRDSVKKLYIDVQPLPTVYAGVDQLICFGDTVHIDASVVTPDTYPNYTYSWSPAGAFSDPTKLHPVFTGYSTTTTVLTVTTPAQCKGVDSATYSVVPASFLVVSADTAICPGDSAQLHVTGAYQNLVWNSIGYIRDTLSTDPFVSPLTTSTYTVTARDSNYCLDTASIDVVVRPHALISLPDSVTIFPGESYAINPGGNGLYFSWFPLGGLSSGTIANPIANPAVNTRYFVTATTEAGCSVKDSIDINVSLDSYIDVPNAFTPGSQPNSILKIVHRGNVKVNTFRIYNRWGAQVFTTRDVNEGWNGQFNNEVQPMGVYVYIVDAITPTGRHFYKQGNVTLIR